MKIGKLPEQVLVRSVIRKISHRREEVLFGPGVGRDCAALQLGEDEIFVMSADPITGTSKDIGSHCIHVTANDLAAAGAQPVAVMVTAMLPPRTEEKELQKIMEDMENTCEKLDMEVIGGHTEVTDVVNRPVLSVTGVGKMKRQDALFEKKLEAGQDLVVTKWIGLEGTSIVAKEKEQELRKVFSDPFVRTAQEFDQYLSVIPESKIAMEHGVRVMHDVTEGGIFGALWEMAEGSGVGLEIDLKKIPIRQETIEVCEQFGLNPYVLMSSGSMLIGTEHGEILVRHLQEAGISAAVVGQAMDGNDRILRNGGKVRYLDKPQSDELYKIYQ